MFFAAVSTRRFLAPRAVFRAPHVPLFCKTSLAIAGRSWEATAGIWGLRVCRALEDILCVPDPDLFSSLNGATNPFVINSISVECVASVSNRIVPLNLSCCLAADVLGDYRHSCIPCGRICLQCEGEPDAARLGSHPPDQDHPIYWGIHHHRRRSGHQPPASPIQHNPRQFMCMCIRLCRFPCLYTFMCTCVLVLISARGCCHRMEGLPLAHYLAVWLWSALSGSSIQTFHLGRHGMLQFGYCQLLKGWATGHATRSRV